MAVLIATAVSGFITPGIIDLMTRDVSAAAQQWRMIIAAIFQINQAFSKIYSVAVSLAIFLWSVSILRNGGLRRGLALYGCAIAALVTGAVVSGHLRLNVHGMALVVVAQAVWFIVAAAELI